VSTTWACLLAAERTYLISAQVVLDSRENHLGPGERKCSCSTSCNQRLRPASSRYLSAQKDNDAARVRLQDFNPTLSCSLF
jgi:hypothetical protein